MFRVNRHTSVIKKSVDSLNFAQKHIFNRIPCKKTRSILPVTEMYLLVRSHL